VTVHALIPALREAVFGGMESTGGSAGFHAKMPIDAGALDLYQAIDQEVAEAWSALFSQVPSAERMEDLIQQVVWLSRKGPTLQLLPITIATQHVESPGTKSERWWVERKPVEFTVEALLRRWVKQVYEFFNPPRRREITAPCVECGEEWGWKLDSGEHRPYRVFVFEQDENGNTLGAHCLSCGKVWFMAQMEELATRIALAEFDDAETVEDPGKFANCFRGTR